MCDLTEYHSVSRAHADLGSSPAPKQSNTLSPKVMGSVLMTYFRNYQASFCDIIGWRAEWKNNGFHEG